MEYFHKLTHVAAEQTGSLLVWMANELNKFSKFNDWEKKNAAREVNDVAIGRYDWRIKKQMKGGRGRRRYMVNLYFLSLRKICTH